MVATSPRRPPRHPPVERHLAEPSCHRRLAGPTLTPSRLIAAKRPARSWDHELAQQFPRWHANTIGRARSATIESCDVRAPRHGEHDHRRRPAQRGALLQLRQDGTVHPINGDYLGEVTAADGLLEEVDRLSSTNRRTIDGREPPRLTTGLSDPRPAGGGQSSAARGLQSSRRRNPPTVPGATRRYLNVVVSAGTTRGNAVRPRCPWS